MGKSDWKPWTTPGDRDENMDRFLSESRSCGCGDKGYIWTPCADVIESENGFVLQVELPGIRLEDVNVELNDGDLYIWGERKFVKEPATHVYHAMECSYGPFARSFKLPVETNKESITASYKNGLLTVTIDKKQLPSRVIEVK